MMERFQKYQEDKLKFLSFSYFIHDTTNHILQLKVTLKIHMRINFQAEARVS